MNFMNRFTKLRCSFGWHTFGTWHYYWHVPTKGYSFRTHLKFRYCRECSYQQQRGI